MSKQIIVGFMTEGPTDVRFLEPIIQRTFEEIALECVGDIDILPVHHLYIPKTSFVEEVVHAAQLAFERGVMVLCVHTDADDQTDENAISKPDRELGLARKPESIADPKDTIVQAIRLAFQEDTRRKRRRRLSISNLYLPIGQKI